MGEIQNYHEADATVTVISSKIYQWMLKLVNKSFRRNKISAWSPGLPLFKIFINYKGKKSNFPVEKLGRYHLN